MAELEDRPAPDPLAGLHKMSTTAGASAQDYVAISNLAILAVLLGAASALTFWSLTLLIVSGAGVVCALVALYYIRHSNGTQTGRGLAWAGLILSVGLGGGSVGWTVQQHLVRGSDREQINQLIAQLKQAVMETHRTGDKQPLTKAYNELFTADFKTGYTAAQFAERWAAFQKQWGEVLEFRSTGLFAFTEGGDAPEARTTVQIKFGDSPGEGDGYARDFLLLERGDAGQWQIRSMSQLFPPPRAGGQQGP